MNHTGKRVFLSQNLANLRPYPFQCEKKLLMSLTTVSGLVILSEIREYVCFLQCSV